LSDVVIFAVTKYKKKNNNNNNNNNKHSLLIKASHTISLVTLHN